MAKNYVQQNIPSILIVEGLWGSGKSTLISYIRNAYPVLFIPEPDYQTSGIKSGITEWYRTEHIKRLRQAVKYTGYGESVVMERSIISNAAFYYAKYGSVPEWFGEAKAELNLIADLKIIFLYNDKRAFLKSVSDIKDKSVRSAINHHGQFYENYMHFFSVTGLDIASVEIKKNNTLPKTLVLLIKKTFSKSIKRKLREIEQRCAGAVVVYKKKFLLLYSPAYKQFALPQGRQKDNETLNRAATREVEEETGFIDLDIVCKIRTYSFRFYNNGKIIHKRISCYLARLRTLTKRKKTLEPHESYKNFFFDQKNVMKKLSWSEDKETVKRARELLHFK